jgi:hypothetical protein
VRINNIAFFNSDVKGEGNIGHSSDDIRNLFSGYPCCMIGFLETKTLVGVWVGEFAFLKICGITFKW